MAKTLTLIEQGARRRADMEDDGNFISQAEARAYINQSIQTFWDFLLGEDGGSLFATVSPQLVKIGDNSYQLPDNFYRLVDVGIKTNGGKYARALQADQQEYAQLLTQTFQSVSYTRYFLHWNVDQDRFELFLFPEPAVENILMRYIPKAPVLSLDSHTLNLPDSWVEWVEIDAAIKMLSKEESDPSALELQQQKLEMRILDAINEINKTGIKKIRDVAYFEDRPRGAWNRLPDIF